MSTYHAVNSGLPWGYEERKYKHRTYSLAGIHNICTYELYLFTRFKMNKVYYIYLMFVSMYVNIYKHMQYTCKYTCLLSGMAQIIRKWARCSMEIIGRGNKAKQLKGDVTLICQVRLCCSKLWSFFSFPFEIITDSRK